MNCGKLVSWRHLPFVILLIVQCVYAITILFNGWPEVHFTFDSPGYMNFDFTSIDSIFSQKRTFGYPLFLQGVESIFGDYEYLPKIQLMLYQISVVVLFLTIVRFCATRWIALVFCLPLVIAILPAIYMSDVATESLGATVLLFSIAMFLRFLTKKTMLNMVGLLVVVYLSYQIKPANVFIMVLFPAVATIYLAYSGLTIIQFRKTLLILVAICFLPYLANSAYRYHKFDSFSHVSFVGANLIAVVTPLINEANLQKLQEKNKALAEDIFEERTKRNMVPYPNFSSVEVITNQRIEAQRTKVRLREDGTIESRLLKWYAEHDLSNWFLAIPIAIKHGHRDQSQFNWVKVDQLLAELSKDIIKLEPRAYLEWISLGHIAGAYRTITGLKFLKYELAILMIILTLVIFKRRVKESLESISAEIMVLVSLPIASYLFATSIILISQPPRFRYIFSASLLLESCVAVCIGLLVAPYVRKICKYQKFKP